VVLKLKRCLIRLEYRRACFKPVGDSKIAETLIDSTGINAVTFTESVPVGANLT
jgi:acyl-CoA reductase-like NAD-dependent aldehyde dehydrogenase